MRIACTAETAKFVSLQPQALARIAKEHATKFPSLVQAGIRISRELNAVLGDLGLGPKPAPIDNNIPKEDAAAPPRVPARPSSDRGLG